MSRMRRVSGAICAVVVALSVAACGQGSTASTEDPGVAQPGGTLTAGAASAITELDPTHAVYAWDWTPGLLLFSSLVKWGPDGDIVGDLATSWSAAEDQRTWTFEIRDDATFFDGTPVTAEDVVSSFDFYLRPESTTSTRNKLKEFGSARAAGPTTVEVSLTAPNAVFDAAATEVRIVDVATAADINSAPNGSGPFRLEEFRPGDGLTLVRNDDYYGDPAPLDRIEIVVVADVTAGMTALRTGDLDVLYPIPYGDARSAEGDPDIRVTVAEPYTWAVSLKVDTTSPPFDDVRARQALSFALDREAVLNTAYAGLGSISTTNNVIPTDSEVYADSGLVEYPYDLERARQLFAEAGITEGDTLTWWGPAGTRPEAQIVAQILQESLREIGIELLIENNEVSVWVEKFVPAGKSFPGLIIPSGAPGPLEPTYLINNLRFGRCECNWNEPGFEAGFERALALGDPDGRAQEWAALQALISQQVPSVIPLQTSVITAVRTDVVGVYADTGGNILHLEEAGLAAGGS